MMPRETENVQMAKVLTLLNSTALTVPSLHEQTTFLNWC